MKKNLVQKIYFFTVSMGLAGAMNIASADKTVVVVSSASSVSSMTAEEVSQLFLGQTVVLPGGVAAVLVDQPEGSIVRNEFYSKVSGKSSTQIKARRARLIFSGASVPPKVAENDNEVKKFVTQTSGAIGYIDSSAIDASVKVVLSVK